ncbi:MAG: PepSY domain-containing protein [Xanthomonadaceae bacterium]|nr:PepSY domain-containing protein [Xanthomonadaceae bacterium]
MRVPAPSAFLVLCAGLLFAAELRAQAEPPPEPAPAAPRERSELPESVLRAERQTGGEVLRAERMQRDGRDVYRLKVLTPDGRVRIMREDPRERRREAWRDTPSQPLLERPGFGERPRFGERPGFGERPATEPRRPPPGELDLPETLPPVERGDHP